MFCEYISKTGPEFRCERPRVKKRDGTFARFCTIHRKLASDQWRANREAERAQRDTRAEAFNLALLDAHNAGRLAGDACKPEPMKIRGFEPIEGGICGFAWVSIWPRNCTLANHCKKVGWSSGSTMGVSLWVSLYGQSYERKTAYADAFAKSLAADTAELCPKASIHGAGNVD